ncbi:MAG TPA: hypothetical protein VIK55_02225 [Paludibacter sp.]
MKSVNKLLIYFVALFVVSCVNPTDMLTVINPDGSCYREFTANANPAFLLGDTTAKLNPFPVDIDSTWNITWKFRNSESFTQFPARKSTIDSIVTSIKSKEKPSIGKEKKSDDFFVQARKNYSTVEEMGVKFKLNRSHEWSNMKVKYELEKKFRWFYTYYTYRETYPKIKLNFEIPIDKYMTKDEAQFWFTGKPNILQGMNGIEIREYAGDLEDKYNKWFAHNNWNNEYKVLVDNYDQMNNKPVTKERLELLKDTIFNANSKDLPDFNMEKCLNNYFKTKGFSIFWKNKDSPLEKFEKDFDEQDFVRYFKEAFTYRLIMPGEVTQPDNVTIQGDTLIWKLTSYRMIYDDYTIEAQSRKANIWAFIFSGIIVVLAIGSFIWKPNKR